MEHKYEDTIYMNAGSSTAIELPFSANPMPKVVWTFNKGSLPDKKRIKTETIYGMTSMTMAKVVRSDSGKYDITMKNDHGECDMTLNVVVLGG